MLKSMTGFGSGRAAVGGSTAAVEIRAVNNRHLKLTVRGPDPYPAAEAEFERAVRRVAVRGSVTLTIVVGRPGADAGFALNPAVVSGYLAQLRGFDPAVLAGVLHLPGVTAPAAVVDIPDTERPAVDAAVAAALGRFDESRRVEGGATAAELQAHHADMVGRLAAVKAHMPQVMAAYRGRLLDRVRQAVADAGVTVEDANVIREVALFADRTDVSEEVHRLTAHFEQFAAIVTGREGGADGAGRRLEFLTQEIGREVNTLGSKAGDVTLSRQVFELKAALERVRELILNVE